MDSFAEWTEISIKNTSKGGFMVSWACIDGESRHLVLDTWDDVLKFLENNL